MDWVEVPPTEWQAFLGRFTAEHRGWRAAIEIHAPGHIPERMGEGMPLQRISTEPATARKLDNTGGGVQEDIAITSVGAGVGGTEVEVSHRVERPLHVRFAQSPYFPDAAVHIESVSGPATVLHVWTNTGRDGEGPSAG